MDTLATLTIFSFPLIFLIHEVEEMIVQRSWILRHQSHVVAKFPFTKGIMSHLARLNPVAFGIAVAEEYLIVFIATLGFLCYGEELMMNWIWIGVVGAFSLHLLIHCAQAIALRAYTPGLLSAIILLPYCCYVMLAIADIYPTGGILIATIAGSIGAATNLLIAHKLGISVSKRTGIHTYRLL